MAVFQEIHGNSHHHLLWGITCPKQTNIRNFYEWTRRLHLMRKWAEMLNKLGGDVTVIHLPDVGLHGEYALPDVGFEQWEVADLLSKWLYENKWTDRN